MPFTVVKTTVVKAKADSSCVVRRSLCVVRCSSARHKSARLLVVSDLVDSIGRENYFSMSGRSRLYGRSRLVDLRYRNARYGVSIDRNFDGEKRVLSSRQLPSMEGVGRRNSHQTF